MGTQKNRLNETVLLSTQNKCSNGWIRKYLQFCLSNFVYLNIPGRVAQSVTCLTTDACLTADLGVASSIPSRSHTFVEIDHDNFYDHSPPFC